MVACARCVSLSYALTGEEALSSLPFPTVVFSLDLDGGGQVEERERQEGDDTFQSSVAATSKLLLSTAASSERAVAAAVSQPLKCVRENLLAEADSGMMERAAAAVAVFDGGWAAGIEVGARATTTATATATDTTTSRSTATKEVSNVIESVQLLDYSKPNQPERVFVWRPLGCCWTAVSFCAMPAEMPSLVANAVYKATAGPRSS